MILRICDGILAEADGQADMDLDEEARLPEWMWKAAAVLAALFTTIAAALALVGEPPAPEVPAPVSDRPTLLVIESPSCRWCARFRASVAPAYELSRLESLAPLRYLDISELRTSGYRLSGRVRGTPTFVLVDRGGHEVGRIPGYVGGPSVFFPQVEGLLEKLPKDS